MINKIGIICASNTELEPFLKQIKITKRKSVNISSPTS